ncbi:MAG: cytochrome c1 [Pseudomonadota bacterium]
MKKLVALLALTMWASAAFAAGSGANLVSAKVDLSDQASLQRGAQLFVNYCLSCHSATYMRYNRVGLDLGLNDQQVKDNLLFVGDKVGATMETAMSDEDAKVWFGVAPPDLSVISRSRGADWLYSYLLAFYEDESRPFGVNNLVFPQVGMPHVLASLQGIQVLKPEKPHAEGEHEVHSSAPFTTKLELKTAGVLSAGEFRVAMRDLTNFLVYVGEPAKLDRYRLGLWVMAFLVVFFFLSRALYKEYWKDVH